MVQKSGDVPALLKTKHCPGKTEDQALSGKAAERSDSPNGRTEYASGNRQVRPWKNDDRFRGEDVIGKTIHLVS